MASVRGSLEDLGWRRIAFSLVVVAFLGLLAFMFRQLLLYPVAGWFENALGLYGDHKIAPHRVHDFSFSLIFWVAAIGMLAQLRNPEENIAGQLMVFIPWISLLLAFWLTDFWGPLPFVVIFSVLTALAAVLHPSGREMLGTFDRSRVNRVLLVLVVVAAVPLLAFASTQVGLHTGAVQPSHDHADGAANHEEIHQEHVDAGHYGLMVAISFIVIGAGLLATLQPVGWWLPAWVAGVVPVVIGAASIAYPDAASGTGTLWGLAAILWGVAFIAAAEYTQDAETPTLLGARGLGGTPE